MRNTIKWTDAAITAELSAISESLGRMPVNNELIGLGRGDLSGAISKNGGFREWAARLGLDQKTSTSGTGWDGETALSNRLRIEGFATEKITGTKSPFDLLIDSHVRIDVKSANYAEYGACKGWFYCLGKYPQADIIAFYQLDTGDCYFIPWQICPKSNVTISRSGGKYAEFKNRYDIIRAIRDRRIEDMKSWPATKEAA